jgi:predicted O-methyltransferase YrrM
MADTTVGDYANDLFGGEDDILATAREDAQREGLPAIQMQPELARLITILIRAAKAREILEVGTLFGYGAITLARAAGGDGRVTTLEVNDRHAAIAQRNLERAGMATRAQIIRGPAIESMRRLTDHSYDLVFIDADKPGYPQYLQESLRLVRPGGLIVGDNVWRGGSVLRADAGDDARAMAEYNHALASNPRLTSTFVPTRNGEDGFSISVVES